MKGILAGLLIGLAAIGYLNVGSIAGACLFSFGLLGIICFELDLFTGKAGIIPTKYARLGIMLLENWIGTVLAALVVVLSKNSSGLIASSAQIVEVYNGSIIHLFVAAICCGICMYIAVKAKSVFALVASIMVFILSGFRHCVADMFYIAASGAWTAYFKLPIVIIGNYIGCNIIPFGLKKVGE